MNNLLLYIGGLVVLVLAALFAVPTFVDWNGYRGVFEEQASRVLGRDVRVGGTVNVRLLPSPYVQFEKVRISDIGEASGEPFFRAESFKMWLAVPPLLRGVLEAHEVELKRPVLRLAADASGGGNWSTVTFAPGALPFVPAEVALEEVKVINGVLSLNGAQGTELARIEGIEGELTSEALDGPYKFKGQAKWEGALRDIRIATAKPEASGAVRFKSTVTVPATRNSYVVEGRLSDGSTSPRIEGELTARINFAGARVAAAPKSEASAAAKADASPGIDLRGKVTGTAAGLEIKDLALTVEQSGPPQIITGEASIAWADKVRLDAGLGSRWLDLDRAAGGEEGARPLAVAQGLFETLTSLLPSEAETNVRLVLDQVNLASEAVSGVRLRVERAGGPLKLTEFRASVPGGGRLALDGVLSVGQAPARFDGNMSLDGQSLLRFLSWALKSGSIGEGRTDQPFGVSGVLHLAETSVALDGAKAEIGQWPLSGAVKLDIGQRHRVELDLEGETIDAGQLFPGSVGLRALSVFKSTSGGAPEPAGESAAGELGGTTKSSTELLDPSQSDFRVRLRAGTLIDAERTLRNVDADLVIERDGLAVHKLRFATNDGLEVDVAGSASGVRGTASGAVRGIVAASSPDAVTSLFRLLDLGHDGGMAARRLSELTPLRLAGTVSLGQRGAAAIDIDADGAVQGGRIAGRLRFDRGREDWSAGPADLMATIEGPRAAQTLQALASGAMAPAPGAIAGPSRKLLFKSAGVPAQGLVSVVSLKGDGLALDYSGRITLPSDGASTAAGSLRISAAEAREVFAMGGIRFAAGMDGVPLEGDADLALSEGALTLKPKPNRFSIGGSLVSGTIKLASGGKSVRLAASLEADSATIPRLLAPLVGAAPALAEPPAPPPAPPIPARRTTAAQPVTPPALASAALTPGMWPEQPFDLAVLDGAEGDVEVRFKTLALDDGLTIRDARLAATLTPAAIKVTALDGAALGGRLNSDMAFERAPAGVGLSGRMTLTAGGAEGASVAAPAATLALDFSGRALSPAALVTSLKGMGKLALADIALSGVGPAPVAATAETALAGKGPAAGEPLVQALKSALRQGQVKLGSIEVPAAIGDGALKLDRIAIDTEEGRATFETMLELATMKVDSEWKIEAKVAGRAADPSAPKVMLPPVSVIYSGKVAGLATAEPVLDSGAFERELTVRKMERDVDELERLRKLDQDKAKAEQERTNALEAERAAKAAAAAAGTPASNLGAAPAAAAGPDAAVPGTPAESTAAADAAEAVDTDRTGIPAGRPLRRVRPPPAKRPAQSWKPFQITPY